MPAQPPANKAMKVVAGTLVAGRYRVTREIGRGGMAYVYEAKHEDIGKRVAVKVLSAEFTSSPVVVERFLREARAAAAVRSPYICDVYDSGKLDDGRPFLVMELLEGESLYERMVRIRQFDPKTTVRIVAHVARGLMKAHAANIVHRDLKPENIFITTNEDGEMQAKVLDFGLAKFYEPANDGGAKARLTREGAIFGTPAYMSPEQVQGQGAVDHRADIWALGCIAYECMTGRTVWSTDKGIAMTFAQIASAPLPQLTKYRPDLPRSVDTWFEKALARDIEERYQSAKELAEGFAAALEQGPPSIMITADRSDVIERVLAEIAEEEKSRPQDLDALDDKTAVQPAVPSPSQADVAPLSARGGGPRTASPIISQPVVSPRPAPDSSRGAQTVRPAAASSEELGAAAIREGHASAIDVGTSSSVKGPVLSLPPPRQSSGRGLTAFIVLVLLGAAGVGAWQLQKNRHSGALLPTPPASSSSASASASGSTASSSLPPLEPHAPTALPKWATLVAEGDAKLASGDLEEAHKRFKEAFDTSGSGIARTLAEHVASAATNKGPCKLAALTRIRPLQQTTGTTGRPTIVRVPTGYLALWTDDHESPSHAHTFSLLLDGSMKTMSNPIDVTPEAESVGRFDAHTLGDRVAVVYTDTRGPTSGMWMRWLDGYGRIAGPGRSIATARAAASTPALTGEGNVLWVAYDEKQETDRVDLFLRKLIEGGVTTTPARIVDMRKGIVRPKMAPPQIAMIGTSLEIVFRVDKESLRPIEHMHLSGDDPQLIDGLPAVSNTREDRALGLLHVLGSPTERADTPNVTCTKDACFVVWQVERTGTAGGAYAAMLDPKTGQMIWKKRFAPNGGRPGVGSGSDGSARVAWYEQGRIRTASISRDGIGPPSIVARVAGDQPAPTVTMGATATEWAIAWEDFEAGRLEPYALRATCAAP